ncbi:MAG: hypothetical protein WCX22_00965 [Methanoregula sp.]|jgi:hypothetical protein
MTTKREIFFKKELVTELREVARLMKATKNPEKKIYYFSAAYGITSRTYRYSFSRDVLLADFVLNTSYQALVQRLKMLKAGDGNVVLDDKIFNALHKGLLMLADAFDAEKPQTQEALEQILTASFVASGPGNYLREKGAVTL